MLQAAGVIHPNELKEHHVVKRVSGSEIALLSTLLPFLEEGVSLSGNYKYPVFKNWFEKAQTESFNLK